MRLARVCFFLGMTFSVATLGSTPPQAGEAAVGAPAQPEGVETAMQRFREQLQAASDVAYSREHSEQEWAEANRILVAAFSDPLFDQLPAVVQGDAFSGAGWAAIRLGDHQRARQLRARATQLNPDAFENWLVLAQLEDYLGNHDAAAIALTTYAKRWPSRVDNEQDFVFQVIRSADTGSQARLDLLQTLFDQQWKPSSQDASELWQQLALERVQRGEREAARVLIEHVSSPDSLVRLRSDKRFDGLFDPQAPQFNVELAAKRRVNELRSQAMLNPTKMAIETKLARAMLANGMYEEVLERADYLLAAPDASFDDPEQKLWAVNNRSTALISLGRVDEAVTQLEQAAQTKTDERSNVNQMLNLGNVYCGLGRADDALAAVAKTGGNMNGYGKTVQVMVRHCADLLRHDKAAAALDLAYLREHRTEGPHVFLIALLRADQLDEAARTIIERLASESTREEMLYDLQDFLLPKSLPANIAVNERWHALLARDDVQRAVDRVGRIQHYDYYGN
jgi:tetratricopeptide (TPR) repeat protein